MAKKVILENFELNKNHIKQLTCLIDSAGRVYLFPMLFAYHLEVNGQAPHWITKKEKRTGKATTILKHKRIKASSVETRLSHIKRFVEYIERNSGENAVHQIYTLAYPYYRDYIEHDLSRSLSVETIDSNLTSLKLFINFLGFLEVRPSFDIDISSSARQYAADNNSNYSKRKYIPRALREKLLLNCDNRSQRLILKMGSEVGLRASELLGLRMEAEGSMKYGLKLLFEQVADSKLNHLDEFEFTLLGKYAKRGTTRTLIFKRELLEEMRRYFYIERQELIGDQEDHGVFFVRSDNKGKGQPISTQHATNVFRYVADQISDDLKDYTFHCLRHSFATELFNEELMNSKGQETRAESAALITVAKRLGHKINKRTGKVSESTYIYIALRHEMKLMEQNYAL